MDNDNKPVSFGRFLRDARLENGIGLDEISSKTKVAVDRLILIENESHDKLPAPAFVKGFVKAYAQAAGADADEAVRLYSDALEALETRRKNAAPYRPKLGRLFLILGICVAVAISFAVYINHAELDKQPEKPAPKTEKPVTSQVVVTPEKQEDRMKVESEKDKLRLKILAIEETWLKVVVDGLDAKAYTLKPGDRMELEALSDFNLLIGNAAGVKLTLNDKDVRIEGKSGQVVNVKIP